MKRRMRCGARAVGPGQRGQGRERVHSTGGSGIVLGKGDSEGDMTWLSRFSHKSAGTRVEMRSLYYLLPYSNEVELRTGACRVGNLRRFASAIQDSMSLLSVSLSRYSSPIQRFPVIRRSPHSIGSLISAKHGMGVISRIDTMTLQTGWSTYGQATLVIVGVMSGQLFLCYGDHG